MQMLEQSLRRLQNDHLDLWQIHGVSTQNDPALFIRPAALRRSGMTCLLGRAAVNGRLAQAACFWQMTDVENHPPHVVV